MKIVRFFKRIIPVLAIGLLLFSCSDNSTGPDTDPVEVTRVNLVDRDSGEEIAHTHGSGDSMHWHGSLPHLHPGEEIEVNVEFLDADGNVIALGGEYTVQAHLASGSDDGVVELSSHGDHVDVEAVGEGNVEIIFSLWHGDHSEFDAPAIGLEVEHHDEASGAEITRVNLIDRVSGDELVHTHGSGDEMHWHGSLPHLHPGDEIEVNVEFLDSNGDPIALGGEYTVQAHLADGSDEGVVEISNHGDHVDIEATGVGEVEIIFSLWHDDHSEFDAPSIALEVEDHH